MFGGTNANECTLSQTQRANIIRKVLRADAAVEALLDSSTRSNKLACQASDAEYEGRNYKKAAMLYKRAMDDDGHVLAMCNYALWFLQGRPGTPKDPPKAVELLKRAAEKGVGMALANLAEFALHGAHGVDKDDDEAYRLARAAIDDDRHTRDSLSMAFMVLFQLHNAGRPGAPAPNKRAALRCLEYATLLDGPNGRASRQGAHELLPTMRFLALNDPEAVQRETDRRYDRMAYELKQLPPERQPGTYGEYVAALRRYGFELASDRGLPKDRSKKCDWPTFIEASGSWRLIKGYKDPDPSGSAGTADGGDAGDGDELGGERPQRNESDGTAARGADGANGAGGNGTASGTASTSGGASGSSGGGGACGFMCGQCKKMGATKKCSRCGQHYCSVECQRADWREGHKRICDMVVAARS